MFLSQQQQGSCIDHTAFNYFLVLNTTDGIQKKDIDGFDDAVLVDWNVLSAALAVNTSNGFLMSEFYHFSESGGSVYLVLQYIMSLDKSVLSPGLNWF